VKIYLSKGRNEALAQVDVLTVLASKHGLTSQAMEGKSR
jgi:hypothetical protein